MEIVKNNLGENEYNYSTEFNTMKQYFANSYLNDNQIIASIEYDDKFHQALQESSPNNFFFDLFTLFKEAIGVDNTSNEFLNGCFEYLWDN